MWARYPCTVARKGPPREGLAAGHGGPERGPPRGASLQRARLGNKWRGSARGRAGVGWVPRWFRLGAECRKGLLGGWTGPLRDWMGATGVSRSYESAPPRLEDHHRALCIGLLQGPRGKRFFRSEVPLYRLGTEG